MAAWTTGVFDSAEPGAAVIARRASQALGPGTILLLHDADGWAPGRPRQQTADALPEICRSARARDLELVTLDELVGVAMTTQAPGRRFGGRRVVLHAARIGVVVAIGVVAAWKLNLGEVHAAFRVASWGLLAVAVIANFASVAFKGLAWKGVVDALPSMSTRTRYRDLISPAVRRLPLQHRARRPGRARSSRCSCCAAGWSAAATGRPRRRCSGPSWRRTWSRRSPGWGWSS